MTMRSRFDSHSRSVVLARSVIRSRSFALEEGLTTLRGRQKSTLTDDPPPQKEEPRPCDLGSDARPCEGLIGSEYPKQ